MRAAITPGTQPQMVSIKTINTEPQPLSITARGGKIIERRTRQKVILFFIKQKYKSFLLKFI